MTGHANLYYWDQNTMIEWECDSTESGEETPECELSNFRKDGVIVKEDEVPENIMAILESQAYEVEYEYPSEQDLKDEAYQMLHGDGGNF